MYSDRCGYLHQNSWPWGKSLLQYLLACKRMIWTTPNHKNHPNTAHSPTSRLWYLSSYHDPLQAHMHPLHKLGNANTIANYHGYYQILIKNGISNEVASSAYLTASYVPVKTKCIIMKYRTGTLFNQKHAVCFKLNKPYLPPLPSTRQCPAYPSWMPTHANKKYYHWDTQLACSMTFKALSKTGSLGSCVIVSMDIGSSK